MVIFKVKRAGNMKNEIQMGLSVKRIYSVILTESPMSKTILMIND